MNDGEEMQNDPEYQAWLEECAKDCGCCQICIGAPCGGCMAGGMCDSLPCRCVDYDDHNCEDDGEYWE